MALKLISSVIFLVYFTHLKVFVRCSHSYNDIDLPESQLPYYYNNFPQVLKECLSNDSCIHRELLKQDNYDGNKCWGYESGCSVAHSFSTPECADPKPAWIKTKEEHVNAFYEQGDFGYIRNQINDLRVYCTPLFPNDSMLECSRNLRFCRGRNIMINFTDIAEITEPFRYKMDVLKHGQIGGYCKMNNELLSKQMDHMSALQSWAPEIRNFVELNERPIEADKCDLVYEKPVFIMKIDASSNMYHHFCDFFNLYASLHVNLSHPNVFDTDNQIFIWETYSYITPFASAFDAFTKNPVFTLKALAGKTVCFKNLMLPLLPRMIFGLYYNTPIINGCGKSGLFQAFSEFMVHRLKVPIEQKSDNRIRITFLERRTKYRQILNSDELINELRKNASYVVRTVQFERGSRFSDQLEVVRNTDVFIGMHGAGLTHLLFLPKWAAIFELYNCEDSECYKDLARLRGVKYITWENKDKLKQQDEGKHPQQGGAHAKFTNYAFDKAEFVRLVHQAADYVMHNEDFQRTFSYNFENLHEEL